MSDELTPITRKETFLAKAGGQNVVTPTPITREETFLQAIIDNGGGGGGTGGGVLVCTMNTQTGALDKTWQEIYDADFAVVHAQMGQTRWDIFPIISNSTADDGYYNDAIIMQNGNLSIVTFKAETSSGYPVGQH